MRESLSAWEVLGERKLLLCKVSSVIGLYEAAFVGVMYGFSSVIIFLSFQMCGIYVCVLILC